MTATTLARPTTDLLYKEMENAHWFADYLTQPGLDLDDQGEFATIVKQAVENYGIDTDAMAARFNIARTTISRWKSGRNAPQPFARPVIVAWLQQRVRAHADDLKAKMGAA